MATDQHAIFVGYRREDAADAAGRVYDRLQQAFGDDAIFKDVDNLPVGVNFGEHILAVLARCQVFLVIIGPRWIDASDETGARRLESPEDWVRVEIETALNTPDLQVVPVLINGAPMPRPDQLPASLRALSGRHGAIVRRDPDFHRDMNRLIEGLKAGVSTGHVTVQEPIGIDFGTPTQNWSRIENSLDPRDYHDFIEVFPNATEVFEARRRKRQLEDWRKIAKDDPEEVGAFAQSSLFDELRTEISHALARATEGRRKADEAAEAARVLREAEAQRQRAIAEERARQEAEQTAQETAKLALDAVTKDWGVRSGIWALETFLAKGSLNSLQELARSGNSAAQVLMGLALSEGTYGLPRDDKEAAQLIISSAESGSPQGRFHLADMIASGKATALQYTDAAAELYRLSAEQGFAEAQYRLAQLFEGEADRLKRYEAEEWYRRAAEQGHVEAMCALGARLGKDSKSPGDAARWYLKAAQNGSVAAQCLFGDALRYGRGVRKDVVEAAKWYRKAAESGHAQAQLALGQLLMAGEVGLKDNTSAARWIRASAEQGFASAQAALAKMLLEGSGVLRNEGEAIEWYRKAADQGDASMQNSLGDILSVSDRVEDKVEAASWYRKAAEQGHGDAQVSLGRMLERGDGVPRNKKQAAKWYAKALLSRNYLSSREDTKKRLAKLREHHEWLRLMIVMIVLAVLASGLMALCFVAIVAVLEFVQRLG